MTQYGLLGDPRETMLEKMAMIELNEAYNYFSCAETESDSRIRSIWEMFARMEITHFAMCAELIRKHEGRDIRDIMKADVIEPLIVFESNKDYVNRVIDEQLDLSPHNMEFVRLRDLPDDWASFAYQRVMNAKGVRARMSSAKRSATLQSATRRRISGGSSRRWRAGGEGHGGSAGPVKSLFCVTVGVAEECT